MLEQIAPERTLDETARRAEEALIGFHPARGTVESWEESRQLMAGFFCRVERAVLHARSSSLEDLDQGWHGCSRILTREYGHNGEKAAFEMARTGSQGGLYAILKLVVRDLAEEMAANEISARIHRLRDGLSLEERMAAGRKYVDKCCCI